MHSCDLARRYEHAIRGVQIKKKFVVVKRKSTFGGNFSNSRYTLYPMYL